MYQTHHVYNIHRDLIRCYITQKNQFVAVFIPPIMKTVHDFFFELLKLVSF